METQLNFEDARTKELLSKYDLQYFLKQNIEKQGYNQTDVEALFDAYNVTLRNLKKSNKKNRKQSNYFLEGQVRKMFTGGFLPDLFHLSDTRELVLFRFQDIGHDLAYFKLWQQYYKRKVKSENVWDIVVKIGSILGILLAILKILDSFLSKNPST